MKTKVLVFTSHGAKILINPNPMPKEGGDIYKVLVNPDLSKLSGVPPHAYFYTEAGEIVKADREIIYKREQKILNKRESDSLKSDIKIVTKDHIKFIVNPIDKKLLLALIASVIINLIFSFVKLRL